MKASYSSVALHIANLGGQIGMSGLECGGCQPQAVLGWRSHCLSASSTGLCVSGQAGLHGNVLQSCCLLCAGANVRQMVLKPPIIHCCWVLLLLSTAQLFAQHTTLFPHFGGTMGITLPKDRPWQGKLGCLKMLTVGICTICIFS